MGGWLMLVCSGGVSVFGSMMMRSGRAFQEAAERVEAATEPTSAAALVEERDRRLHSGGAKARTGAWEYRQVYGTVAALEAEAEAEVEVETAAVVEERKTYSVVMDQMHECSDVLVHASREERPFLLEVGRGRVLVEPSGSLLAVPAQAHYTHDFSKGPPPGGGVSQALSRALSSEKEVGVLETKSHVPLGSTAYVTGAVRSDVDSSGMPVLRISACPNPRLPFVVSDRPVKGLLSEMHDRALARQFLGIALCLVGLGAALAEHLVPSSFRSYSLAPYKVREIITEHGAFQAAEYVVTAPMNIVMDVADALQVLRASGKVPRSLMPAEVTEQGQAFSFKFYTSKPAWSSDYCRTLAFRTVGWLGVGIGFLSVLDFYMGESRQRS